MIRYNKGTVSIMNERWSASVSGLKKYRRVSSTVLGCQINFAKFASDGTYARFENLQSMSIFETKITYERNIR